MRRQSGVPLPAYGTLVFQVSNPSTIRLADTVGPLVAPPPPVPLPDPSPHAEAAASAAGGAEALRRLVRPASITLDSPSLTYTGRDVTVVRL